MANQLASDRRKARLRFRIAQKAKGRIRLSVFRSNKYIYAQLIDDEASKTLVAASSREKELLSEGKPSNIAAAHLVGKKIAERALKKGISEVVFDRGAYLYHGRVRALADGAREVGLSF